MLRELLFIVFPALRKSTPRIIITTKVTRTRKYNFQSGAKSSCRLGLIITICIMAGMHSQRTNEAKLSNVTFILLLNLPRKHMKFS